MFDASYSAEEFTDEKLIENEQNLKPGEMLVYSQHSEERCPYDYNQYNQCVNYSHAWAFPTVIGIFIISIVGAIFMLFFL